MSETETPAPPDLAATEEAAATNAAETNAAARSTAAPEVSASDAAQAAAEEEADQSGFSVKDRRWWARKPKEGSDADTASHSDADDIDESGKADKADKAVADASAKMIAWLRDQLEEKQRQAEEATARQRRALAEMERTKERIERESARQIELRRRKLIVGFLDVVDDLDRAIDAAHAQTENDDLLDGVELVARRFLTMLEAQGVVREDPSGQAFDPNRHEAVTMVPVANAEDDGKVVGVIKPGYLIGEEVLRPAQVAVGRKG